MGHATADTLTRELLAWYARHARDLPWRKDPTPYHILLSEVMAQQTRLDTMLAYYERFLARWPTLADLAAANEDEVLEAWAGLGYYSRARRLHEVARLAVSQGGLPQTSQELRALPGLGPYTAGAIASIAFGEATPAVDGNVERVLSRVDARAEDPRSAPGRRALADRAQQLVRAGPPSAVNQGLMELGALVCSPRSPRCEACPWGEVCLARQAGAPEQFPVRPPRKPPEPMAGVAGVLVRRERVLLGRRPRGGLLGGLWEPISGERSPREASREALVRVFRERAGLEVQGHRHLGHVTHVFSHRRLTLEVFEVTALGSPTPGFYTDLAFVEPGAPEGHALSRLAQKVLALPSAAQPTLLAAEPTA